MLAVSCVALVFVLVCVFFFFNLSTRRRGASFISDDIFMKLSRWWRLLVSGICSFQDLLVSGITRFRSCSFKDLIVSGSGLRIKVRLVYMSCVNVLMCVFKPLI